MTIGTKSSGLTGKLHISTWMKELQAVDGALADNKKAPVETGGCFNLHFQFFLDIFHVLPEVFVGIFKVIHCFACVKNGCMVFTPNLSSNTCE